ATGPRRLGPARDPPILNGTRERSTATALRVEKGGRTMTGIGVRVALLVACLAASGCTTYNPATGQYQTDPYATSALVGGIRLASGVALGAALSDNDCCWGGYHGGNVYAHNNYKPTGNHNQHDN